MNQVIKTKRVSKPALKTVATKKILNSYVVEYPSFYAVFTCILKLSTNEKTGCMIQSYFLSKENLHHKSTFGAKCLDCPVQDVCYVEKDKLAVRTAVNRLINGESTSYKFVDSIDDVKHALKGRSIRFGTYGDPSCMPLEDVAKIVSWASNHTGYTHFWKSIDSGYSDFFMASVESLADEMLSNTLGYRHFRLILDEDQDSAEVVNSSIACPHYETGIQCAQCKLCSGNQIKAKSIYVFQHGVKKRKAK